MSIDYLLVANAEARPKSVLIVPRIPDDVINYIYEHNIREYLAEPSKGKEQATAGTSTS